MSVSRRQPKLSMAENTVSGMAELPIEGAYATKACGVCEGNEIAH